MVVRSSTICQGWGLGSSELGEKVTGRGRVWMPMRMHSGTHMCVCVHAHSLSPAQAFSCSIRLHFEGWIFHAPPDPRKASGSISSGSSELGWACAEGGSLPENMCCLPELGLAPQAAKSVSRGGRQRPNQGPGCMGGAWVPVSSCC